MKLRRNRSIRSVLFLVVLFFTWVSVSWSAQPDYDGPYYGSFAGDDSGVWVAWIEAGAESVFLSLSNTNEGDGAYLSWRGEVGSVGNYGTSSTAFNGSSVDAFIDSATGTVTGTWSNPFSGDTGTLSGNVLVSSAFAGNYSGAFSGDSSGTWSLTIDANGYISGSMTSDDGTGFFEGGCHPDGTVLAIGTDGLNFDFAVFGTLSGTTITGRWESETGETGTIGSGSGSSGGGGGGGGGGCFVDILASFP